MQQNGTKWNKKINQTNCDKDNAIIEMLVFKMTKIV